MREAVNKVSERPAAAFLLDQAVRLKNKIGQQMSQVNRQKRPKEDLHSLVEISRLRVSFNYENARSISEPATLAVSVSCQ